MKHLVILFLLVGLACTAFANYEVIDLGVLEGGVNSFATGINCQGQVCGFSFFDEANHAFTDSQMVPKMTEAYGIDDCGTIVGTTLVRNRLRPSVYRNGKTYLLQTLGGQSGCARAISGNIIVGQGEKRYGIYSFSRPCLWIGRRAIDLFSQPGIGWAADINRQRQVAGTFFPEGQGPSVFLWQRGRVEFLGPGYASAINDKGDVVGYSPTENGFQATLWRGRPIILSSLDGQTWANDINNLGEIVGLAQTPQGFRAVIWQNGQIKDLNSLVETDWMIFSAQAINDRGQIACRGNKEGKTHALLLNPLSQ